MKITALIADGLEEQLGLGDRGSMAFVNRALSAGGVDRIEVGVGIGIGIGFIFGWKIRLRLQWDIITRKLSWTGTCRESNHRQAVKQLSVQREVTGPFPGVDAVVHRRGNERLENQPELSLDVLRQATRRAEIHHATLHPEFSKMK